MSTAEFRSLVVEADETKIIRQAFPVRDKDAGGDAE